MASSAELRKLRRRIKSVKSTQQITRAMEMIAASRIQRAQRRVEEATPYAQMITEIIRGLAASNEVRQHPLLAPHEQTERIAVVVVSSDRGLAGAYNSNVLREAERVIRRERGEGHDVQLYLVGRKALGYFRFRGTQARESWTGFSERPQIGDAQAIAKTLMAAYTEGEIDRVWLVYTDYKSSLVQAPNSLQILPVDPEEFAGGDSLPAEFMYEPGPETILDRLIPRYVEAEVFAGLLESAASEQAMRQRAMKSASENAEDVVRVLSRSLNAARQAQITQEIAEIVGGAEGLAVHR